MKKHIFYAAMAAAAAAMMISGCGTQVGGSAQSTSAQASSAAAESSAPAESEAASEAASEAESGEAADAQKTVEKKFAQAPDVEPWNLTEEEQAAWEKEPAYGKTIKVGYNGGLCLGGFGIAQANGFYEAEGLKTEIFSMTSTTDAVGTGKVDVAADHIATLLVPAVNGVKMTFTTASATGCKSLYVLTDSDIKKTSDLIGKTVAVADGIGSSDMNITMRFFNHDNIDPNQVNFKAVTNDAVILAMQKGEVQAATLSDQFAKKFVDDGTLRYIRSITWDPDFAEEPCCVMAINSDFMKANPITSKKLTRAFRAASNWIEDNKEEAVDIMMENSWASGDKSVLLDMANSFNFRISDEATGAALKDVIDDYKHFGLFDDNTADTNVLLEKLWKPLIES